jgi:hypothetical protein
MLASIGPERYDHRSSVSSLSEGGRRCAAVRPRRFLELSRVGPGQQRAARGPSQVPRSTRARIELTARAERGCVRSVGSPVADVPLDHAHRAHGHSLLYVGTSPLRPRTERQAAKPPESPAAPPLSLPRQRRAHQIPSAAWGGASCSLMLRSSVSQSPSRKDPRRWTPRVCAESGWVVATFWGPAAPGQFGRGCPTPSSRFRRA